jgi:hypothetical protein
MKLEKHGKTKCGNKRLLQSSEKYVTELLQDIHKVYKIKLDLGIYCSLLVED